MMVEKDFFKKGVMELLWLKITNRSRYKQYKVDLKEYELNLVVNSFLEKTDHCDVNKIIDLSDDSNYLHIVHSGHLGDVIYALPTIKKISSITKRKINFYLKLNQYLTNPSNHKHPLGNIMLNEQMVQMLIPLISNQDYINKCLPYSQEKIHIDLDNFRKVGLQLDRGNIGRWCGYITGVNPELHKPWLNVAPDLSFADTIIIARSERYRNSNIDYSFLQAYNNIAFVGVKAEYENMKLTIPQIKWVEVTDFLRLAQIIAGCKFFIGNQSFPFSLAEGLKVPRILETYMIAPNVIPEGDKGYDFLFQSHFEWLVAHLNQGVEL